MNWRERVKELQKLYVSVDFVETCVNDAGDFKSCAVGERRELLQQLGYVFNTNYTPRDSDLDRLGMQFFTRIRNEDYDAALEILDQLDAIVAAGRQSSAAPRSS